MYDKYLSGEWRDLTVNGFILAASGRAVPEPIVSYARVTYYLMR